MFFVPSRFMIQQAVLWLASWKIRSTRPSPLMSPAAFKAQPPVPSMRAVEACPPVWESVQAASWPASVWKYTFGSVFRSIRKAVP